MMNLNKTHMPHRHRQLFAVHTFSWVLNCTIVCSSIVPSAGTCHTPGEEVVVSGSYSEMLRVPIGHNPVHRL